MGLLEALLRRRCLRAVSHPTAQSYPSPPRNASSNQHCYQDAHAPLALVGPPWIPYGITVHRALCGVVAASCGLTPQPQDVDLSPGG